MIEKITDYDQIRPKLDNGDLVLCRGKGLASALILWACSLFSKFKPVKFSHIGFIVVDAGRVMLCESTTLQIKNTSSDSFTAKGVRLVPLSQLAILYPGEICIRQLVTTRTPEMLEQLKQYVSGNLGKPYERHLSELIESAINHKDFYKGDDNTDMFCSELVAGLYKLWGLLPCDIPANEYDPEEFTDGGIVDGYLTEDGARLLERIRIK